MKPLLSNADSSALVESISFALLDALPPLYRKVRPRVVTALAHRLARPWRAHVPLAPHTLVVALRELARTLETELTEVEQKTASFVAAWNEATDDADRRALLIRHLDETVPNPRERRKDLRALKRWMGFDALRERLEGQKQRLLVQQEMVFRCLGGFFTSARNTDDDSAPLQAEAAETAALLLDAALRNVRLQNQLAALEGLTAVLALTRTALARNPEARVTLEALVQRQGASPWLQSAALDALMRCDLVIGTNTLAQRLRNPWTHPRDFLFRRQALENAALVLPEEALIGMLSLAAGVDGSEYVRIGVAELLVRLEARDHVLRRLAGLEEQEPEKSPRVRAAAVLAASQSLRTRAPGWQWDLRLITEVILRDEAPLVLRLACDQVTLFAESLVDEAAQEGASHLESALAALKTKALCQGAVLESAAAADLALQRARDPARRAWSQFIAEALRNQPLGKKLKLIVDPPPAGLPPLRDDPEWLGAVLAALSLDDYGYYADRSGRTLQVWRGDRLERRAWRMKHELLRPAPNKRQGFIHTVGRNFKDAPLRAHPAHMDEITATTVPGERVHVATEGSWGRHLPTIDDLLDLPVGRAEPVRIFSSHGVTTLTPPASLSARIKNRLRISKKYEHLNALRLSSLGGQESRERRRFVEAVEQDLGVSVRFTPFRRDEAPPQSIATLFGVPAARRADDTTLHSVGFAQAGWIATFLDVLLERNDYFFGTRGNGILALSLFTAGLFTYFLTDAWRKRDGVRIAREQIPLCIGGWGTRGKSGTERLKAALFNGLGFEVFAKTTGSEAMFVHASPAGTPHEFFIYRPYDKATIWEQRDMVSLGARLGVEVFLWECMALQPGFVELLQNDWMHDDLATLTNAYPDHEDIQGPAGQNVAEVITNFMPEGGKVVTTEDHFLPLFKQAARDKGTNLVHSPWWEAELIPPELLDQFPYAEHPRNMALVATLAGELGIQRTRALGLMAEHVQPEIGVLKVFPRVQVRGRVLSFINGHSANERTGFLNNWTRTGLDRVDPNADPDRAVVTVINNRWDRVARSEVFARIMVEDASADRHVLIGTNLEGLQKYVRDAIDPYLAQREVLSPDDLSQGDEGLRRAHSRLARELAHLKVPLPTVDGFLERLSRYARGAHHVCTPTASLTKAVAAALSGSGDELHVSSIRAQLSKELGRLIDESLSPAAQSEDPWLPEVLEPTKREEIREHALYLLARMVVHARLRRMLPGPGGGADPKALVASYHRRFRAAWKELFLEQLVTVPDAHATGDQVIDACARAVPPGLEVSVIGAQNIKGTGLDWVYRWMALDKVHGALKALDSGSEDERRRALELLETFGDNGLVDTGLARHVLPQLIQRAATADEANRLSQVAQSLGAVHDLKLSALVSAREGSRTERVIRSVEKLFDYLDSVRRRKIADQLVDDLVHGRVSHARAAIETRRLYERQKGGWLFANWRKRAETSSLPTQVQPKLTAPAGRAVFDKALEVPHDAAVKVPSAVTQRPQNEASPQSVEASTEEQTPDAKA